MSIVNVGSLNIDLVFRVAHIVRGGETIAGTSFRLMAGGKGANQSVALARAGVHVIHVGKVGAADGSWLVEKLAGQGIDTRFVSAGSTPTGQAVIQVDDRGENAIVLHPGANREITAGEVDEALDAAPRDAWLLVQNETSAVAHAIAAAAQRGMRVAFNPAPFDDSVPRSGWERVDLLCVNQFEGAALSGQDEPEKIMAALARRAPRSAIVLTLGTRGVLYRDSTTRLRLDARKVDAVDTTAAGDTFVGYYLAHRSRGEAAVDCLEIAVRAAAVCVTRAGAIDSIPHLSEVVSL